MAVENKHEIEIDDIFVKECMIYCDGFFIKKTLIGLFMTLCCRLAYVKILKKNYIYMYI